MPIAIYAGAGQPPNTGSGGTGGAVLSPAAIVGGAPSSARWSFSYGPWNQLPTAELSNPKSRSVTWRLTPDTSEAGFTTDGSRPEVAGINEVLSGLWVLRDGQALYRGLLGASSWSLGPENVSRQYSSADFRAVLTSAKQILDSETLVYTGDQAAIAWQLIDLVQSRTAGSLGIVRGSGQTTGYSPPTQNYAAGAFIGDLINQLAQTPNGFDWDLTPNIASPQLTFDVWHPQRGTDRQKVLDYPGQIQTATRNVDPSTFRNVLRGTGTDAIAAYTATSSTLGTDGAPRLEGQYSDSDLQTLSALHAATDKQLALGQNVTPSWTVTLAPNIWDGPGDVWIGDPVTVAVKSDPTDTDGPYDIVETWRVQEIQLDLDDDTDTETVKITLGQPKPDRRWRLRAVDSRISKLERR